MKNSIKVVIADDVEPILLYLEKIISEVEEFEIVGKAKNGNELVDLVINNKPEIVITDIEMPECNGLQAIEKLSSQNIKSKYVILTGNTSYLLTDRDKQLGILKVIKKPILDDNKFIGQIRDIAMVEEKMEIEEKKDWEEVKQELTPYQRKKENILIRIINKIFRSK